MAEDMVEIRGPGQIRELFEDPSVPDALKNLLAWIMHYTPDPEILNHRLFGMELGMRLVDQDSKVGLDSLVALDNLQQRMGIPIGADLDKAVYTALTTPFQGRIADAEGTKLAE